MSGGPERFAQGGCLMTLYELNDLIASYQSLLGIDSFICLSIVTAASRSS
jgi:hypothetical protein